MKLKSRVTTVMLVVLTIMSFTQAAFATIGDGVHVSDCNGIIPTPGSANTLKTLVNITFNGTQWMATYNIHYPLDPTDVGQTFVISDCLLLGQGSDLKTYAVIDSGSFTIVPNNVDFSFNFTAAIPATAVVGDRVCNVAKTTSSPSASPSSNRKAGPACFTVGGDARVEKHSTTDPNGDPIGGATFTVWNCNNTADDPVLQPIILTPAKSSGNIYSSTLAGGAVVHATDGYIAFSGPSGSTCNVTETSPPAGYDLPSTVTQTITIPTGTSGATIYKFLDPPSPGSIKIVKVAPASQSATVFHFSIDCTHPNNTYTAQITGSGNTTINDIPAGSSCQVSETSVPSIDDVAVSPPGTFTVESGKTFTVTVTNSLKPGNLTITKVAPAGSTDTYDFTVTCTNDPNSPYSKSITGSGSTTINGIPAGSECTVAETDPGAAYNPPGYSPSNVITIQPNDTVTVTVTNTLKPGGLTVTKHAPAGSTEQFSFTVTCTGDPNSPYTFQITGSDSHTVTGIPAGTSCTVAESSPGVDFNAPQYSPNATVVVVANDTVTVAVTNTLKSGSLQITKVAPAGSTDTYDFTVTCTNPHTSPVGPYTASITGSGSSTISDIPAGSVCTVAETDPGATYNAPQFSPSDTVTVTGDETVTVTVTNTLKPGSLTINKVAPAGATDTYTFNVDCGGNNTYQLQITGSGSATQDGIPAGSVCTISEVVPAGYAQPSYDPSNQVTVDANQSVSVTVTNTLLPLAISIVKTANPISGGPGDPVTYTYVVKNTGQVDLINVSVDDDKLGHIGTIASLTVGESKTLTFKTTLPTTAGALTNVGTATGHDRFGRTTTAHDNATVTVVLAITLPRTGGSTRLPLDAGFAFLGLGIAIVGIASSRKKVVYNYEDDEM
jgi:hypothetical protein